MMVFAMIICHYSRENFEAIIIKDFGQKTMGHNHLAYQAAVQWIWVGFGISFYNFHPFYTASEFITLEKPLLLWCVVLMFTLTELMSFLSDKHLSSILHYKKLYPQADPKFWIPQHHGF